MILKNKKWLRPLASVINYLIKEYYDDIIQIYDLDPEYFYINKSGRNNPKTTRYNLPGKGRSSKDTTKYQRFVSPWKDDKDKSDDTEDDNEEELQLKI